MDARPKLLWLIGIVGAVAMLAITPASSSQSAANVVRNGGAEDSGGVSCKADTGFAPPAGWHVTGHFTALKNDCSPPLGGVTGGQFFAGGDAGTSSASQDIDLAASAAAIDGGGTRATLSALLGGYESQRDHVSVQASFLDAGGRSLGALRLEPVTPAERGNRSMLVRRSASGTVPPGTRRVRIVVTAVYVDGAVYNDGYADDISLTLAPGPPVALPPPPATNSEAVPVPIESVSNGCGGGGWKLPLKIMNAIGNYSTYHNSNHVYNVTVRGFEVDFTQACNLHDAGYSGAIVRDRLRGGIKDFRRWTRLQVDKKFLADLRLLCERQIPRSKSIALANCRESGGNLSFGAETRYNVVRCFGHRLFDADPGRPGRQATGPRKNDRVAWLSRNCRFKDVQDG